MSEPKFVTCAEFSRRHNVSRKTVSLWLKRGLIASNENGRVDVEASEAKLSARPAVIQGGVTRGPNCERGNATVTRSLRSKIRAARAALNPDPKMRTA